MSLLLALAAAAAPLPAGAPPPIIAPATTPQDGPVFPADLPPATVPAIVAGAKACVGTVVDPTGVTARFAGWNDTVAGMSARDIAGMKAAHGRMLQRDNVRVVLQPGREGGCITLAAIPAGFDQAAFGVALGRALGITVAADGPTALRNGETLMMQTAADKLMIMVASPDDTSDDAMAGDDAATPAPAGSTPPAGAPSSAGTAPSHDQGN